MFHGNICQVSVCAIPTVMSFLMHMYPLSFNLAVDLQGEVSRLRDDCRKALLNTALHFPHANDEWLSRACGLFARSAVALSDEAKYLGDLPLASWNVTLKTTRLMEAKERIECIVSGLKREASEVLALYQSNYGFERVNASVTRINQSLSLLAGASDRAARESLWESERPSEYRAHTNHESDDADLDADYFSDEDETASDEGDSESEQTEEMDEEESTKSDHDSDGSWNKFPDDIIDAAATANTVSTECSSHDVWSIENVKPANESGSPIEVSSVIPEIV